MVIASDNWNADTIRPVGLIEAINCCGSYWHLHHRWCHHHCAVMQLKMWCVVRGAECVVLEPKKMLILAAKK